MSEGAEPDKAARPEAAPIHTCNRCGDVPQIVRTMLKNFALQGQRIFDGVVAGHRDISVRTALQWIAAYGHCPPKAKVTHSNLVGRANNVCAISLPGVRKCCIKPPTARVKLRSARGPQVWLIREPQDER